MQRTALQSTRFLATARWFSVLLVCIVVGHGAIMAMDPHPVHAAGHDAPREFQQGLICGVQDSLRLPTNPGPDSPPQADVPASVAVVSVPIPVDAYSGWWEPVASAAEIRVFLQVFLN